MQARWDVQDLSVPDIPNVTLRPDIAEPTDCSVCSPPAGFGSVGQASLRQRLCYGDALHDAVPSGLGIAALPQDGPS